MLDTHAVDTKKKDPTMYFYVLTKEQRRTSKSREEKLDTNIGGNENGAKIGSRNT